MKRTLVILGACLMLGFSTLAVAKEKKPKVGPLTGTWECTSHGSSQGDMAFTLYLEQNKEDVSGSVSSPMGGTELSSATFKKGDLEIEIDTPQGNYKINGKLKKGHLSGTWSNDTEKGTWEGKKQAEGAGSPQ
jgi:hypothetical protein